MHVQQNLYADAINPYKITDSSSYHQLLVAINPRSTAISSNFAFSNFLLHTVPM